MTGCKKAEYQEYKLDKMEPDEVMGKTIVSVISPGTELARYKEAQYPYEPGYACIFEVEEIGDSVTDISIGDTVFCEGKHRSYQRMPETKCHIVPENMAVEDTVFVRFVKMAHSIRCLSQKKHFSVLGRGLVASFLKQIDGCTNNSDVIFDCTENEKTILTYPPGSTIYLVGRPWRQNSKLSAHNIYSLVFLNRITLKSGWEERSDDYESYMKLQRQIKIENLYDIDKPANCQAVYNRFLNNRKKLTTIFDWREEENAKRS